MKVATESSMRSATVAEVERDVASAERFDPYDEVIKERLPGLSRDCVACVTCMYTTTPDGDFVVDRHPEHPSVVIVSACSGHGFKHGPAVGEYMASRILDGAPSEPRFSLSTKQPVQNRAIF